MARSKRENLLIIGVAAAVGVFALDRYVLTPYTDARDAIAADRAAAAEQLADASRLFQRERQLRKAWADMQAAGVDDAPSEAERRMLHAVRQWAQDAVVRNLSLRPERTNREPALYLNRLSDLLFILSRAANPGGDVLWQPGGARG